MMMEEPRDPTFRLFHRYRRLVRRGVVKPLRHSCGTEYVTRLYHREDLALYCFSCDAAVIPGLDLLQQVNAVVTEHFE